MKGLFTHVVDMPGAQIETNFNGLKSATVATSPSADPVPQAGPGRARTTWSCRIGYNELGIDLHNRAQPLEE